MKYEWKCKACDTHVTVERKVDDYDKPPTSDEAPATDECLHPDVWVKVYTSTVPFETLRNKGVFEMLPRNAI